MANIWMRMGELYDLCQSSHIVRIGRSCCQNAFTILIVKIQGERPVRKPAADGRIISGWILQKKELDSVN